MANIGGRLQAQQHVVTLADRAVSKAGGMPIRASVLLANALVDGITIHSNNLVECLLAPLPRDEDGKSKLASAITCSSQRRFER